MRLARSRGHSLMKMNMTPMMDVTFQLLIFFMTATQMSQVNREQLDLPKLQGSQDREERGMTVNVADDGRILVNGTVLTLDELVARVGTELARVDNDPSRLQIEIRADRRGASRGVNSVVEALAKLQVKKIRIGVQVPGRAP